MGGRSTYSAAGVDTDRAASETESLATILGATAAFRKGGAGASLLDIGYYASALRLTDELALGVCTDGVGSKILVAERMGKLDTIGIDCVAMNVNDLVCIGAEPICMLDYMGVEQLRPGLLAEVAKGLAEGARQCDISIPGGETAQLPEMIKGLKPGSGLDLVGTAVGVLPVSRLNCGRDVRPGDVVLGFESTGLHSNGYTLARRVLLEDAGYDVDAHLAELGRPLGEELLEPTRIYVREALELWNSGLDVKALCHITGDGLLNLLRVAAPVSFRLDTLPEIPPVFELIRRIGDVEPAEMFTVFNMGIGFCAIVAEGDVEAACAVARKHGSAPHVLGRAIEGADRRVELPQHGLAGSGNAFSPAG